MIRSTIRSVLLASLTVIFLDCSENEPPDLHQAVAVISWQLAEYNISRSMFAAVLPNGTPRQWVSYYFSTMGVAEHPPGEEHAMEDERETARVLRMPLWPKGVLPRIQSQTPSSANRLY